MVNMINGMFPGEMYPNTTVAGCIDIYENVWPDPYNTIFLLENECSNPESGISWQRATTLGHGANQNIRTNYNINVTSMSRQTGNQVASNIHNQFYMMLLASVGPYAKKFNMNDEVFYHEDYSVLRYRSNQKYDAHYDGGTNTGRSISAICYLNNDYVGGEIEFVNFGVKIKPEPGMLILFPSNYAYSHIAHPVEEGTKYAIVTWIRDRYVQ
jgi:predicted 2-oxoglutarate/Fe(II)-dependent dioxygenase YbiX